jgi:hypothetical protein
MRVMRAMVVRLAAGYSSGIAEVNSGVEVRT